MRLPVRLAGLLFLGLFLLASGVGCGGSGGGADNSTLPKRNVVPVSTGIGVEKGKTGGQKTSQ